MFDIGFPELLLVSVVMLLVFGPERLPEVLRNVGRFVGGARRSFDSLRSELEREVGADEIRRELHNARIMEEAKKLGSLVEAERDEVEELLGERYAALKDEGAIDKAADSDDPQATETASAEERIAPVPDEGNDEASANAAEPAEATPDAAEGQAQDTESREASKQP